MSPRPLGEALWKDIVPEAVWEEVAVEGRFGREKILEAEFIQRRGNHCWKTRLIHSSVINTLMPSLETPHWGKLIDSENIIHCGGEVV